MSQIQVRQSNVSTLDSFPSTRMFVVYTQTCEIQALHAALHSMDG